MEVKKGYKQTEVGVIPSDWEVKKFREVTDVITCGLAATPKYVNEGMGFPFLSSTNVKNGIIKWESFKYIGKELHRNLYKNNPPEKGDILYSRVGTIGEAAIIDVDFEFSIYVSLTLIKPKKLLYNEFLKQLLNSIDYKNRANNEVFLGGGVGNLNVDVVREYPIPIPSYKEQTAIATALSDADALISRLEQLIAKKQNIKQGAMQELLTGKKRLPGFSGEWEVRRLGEVVEIIPSGIYGEEKPRDNYESFRVATTAHINANDNWNNKEMSCRYFSKEQIAKCLPLNGDLIVVKSSGSAEKIQSGKVGYIGKENAGKFLFSNFLMLLRPGSISSIFLYYYLTSYNVKKLLPTLVEASTYPNIRIDEYLDLAIPYPSHEEQTAIAQILSDMDAEIGQLEKKLYKYRMIKQGMMQELLTGKRRLI